MSESYKRYLFDYRFDGAEWGIEVVAKSPQEARERLGALTWATYKGEVALKVPIPGGGLLSRFLAWARGPR